MSTQRHSKHAGDVCTSVSTVGTFPYPRAMWINLLKILRGFHSTTEQSQHCSRSRNATLYFKNVNIRNVHIWLLALLLIKIKQLNPSEDNLDV